MRPLIVAPGQRRDIFFPKFSIPEYRSEPFVPLQSARRILPGGQE
jgi:hypothetical protein